MRYETWHEREQQKFGIIMILVAIIHRSLTGVVALGRSTCILGAASKQCYVHTGAHWC